MIASCTSSLNTDTCAVSSAKRRSTRSSVARTSSGLRFGSGAVNVAPVDTSWYNSAGVANRYAFAMDAVIVHVGVVIQESTAFGENLLAVMTGCVTVVLPLAL